MPCKLAASKVEAVTAVESNNTSVRFSPLDLVNDTYGNDKLMGMEKRSSGK